MKYGLARLIVGLKIYNVALHTFFFLHLVYILERHLMTAILRLNTTKISKYNGCGDEIDQLPMANNVIRHFRGTKSGSNMTTFNLVLKL